ncbi:hypothetical protein ACE193_12490 [Bernardetia sp. OM2101]|uniref:hypothetical protein n=1 Tax=Bernardetia sp. OM2101 TaxID=3344876 RepID=UPI0035D10D51
MNKLALFIVLFFTLSSKALFAQTYNEYSIILEKGTLNYLYKGCENRVEIIIPEIEGDYLGLLVVSAHAKVEQNKELPYIFSISPKLHAEKVTLELYFYGDKIATKYFRLKPFPIPKVVLFSYRKDKIVESRISRLPSYVAIQFSLGNFENEFLAHENNYKADFFEVKLYRADKVIFSSKIRESVFSTDTSLPFWQLPKTGDYLTVKAVGVKRKAADGKIHKVRQLKNLKIEF